MRLGARIAVFVVVMLAAGCGINAHLPASRLETPETYGRPLAFGVDLGVQGSNSLSLTSDYTISPVDTDEPTYTRSTGVKIGASVGLAERFDLALKTAWDSPLLLQGKYQLLGDPQGTAKQGNSSLAVTAAIGNHNQGGESDDTFSGGDDAYSMNAYMADASVIAGYRFSDNGLVFGGPFVQQYWISGTHTLDGAPEVAYDLDAQQYGVNLAIAFTINRIFQLTVEAVFVESRASDADVRSGFLGAQFGIVQF
jgi:hypothetical protein